MEWTRDKTLELLREYEQRRVLWDWNARGYRDRAKRKRAIQELAEILRCNTLEVEKKITNLKCQYSREVHKIQNSREAATGPDDVYVSKWFAFKAMQFLQFGTRRYSERVDAVLEANQLPGKYQIFIQGLYDCRGLTHKSFVLYEDLGKNPKLISEPGFYLDKRELPLAEEGFDCWRISPNTVCSLDLKNARYKTLEEEVDETIYISYDVNVFNSIAEEMTDYSYNIYNFTFYPAYLSMPPDGIKIVQIGGMSFKYPSSPMLSQPENIPEKMLCSFEKRSSECADTPIFCECLQLLEVPLRKNLEIILVDEGFNGNTSYTLHLHGYNAAVVGRGSFGRAVSKKEIVALDQKGKLERNIVDPVKKDSFLVPNKGYLILRFDTSNRGYWLWEARSTAISPGTHGPGMQFLMRVGLRENLPTVPIDFPLCGSNKGPDLIFEAT